MKHFFFLPQIQYLAHHLSPIIILVCDTRIVCLLIKIKEKKKLTKNNENRGETIINEKKKHNNLLSS